jgi:hypothetical protein
MKYLLEFSQFNLTEGGNAFEGTAAIAREKIEEVISEFNKTVIGPLLNSEPAELIGSWKQKPISGDIDCLVYTNLTLPEIVSKLQSTGLEAKAFFGFNIVSVKFTPQNHDAVQVDMFIRAADSNKETTDIFYKNIVGDPNTTKQRVYLLFTMLDSIKEVISGTPERPEKYSGYMLRPDGLYKFIKVLKKINYKIESKELVAQTAEEMSQVLFGESLPFEKWNTFSKTLNLFNKSKLYKDKEQILRAYIDKLNEEGITIPAELT